MGRNVVNGLLNALIGYVFSPLFVLILGFNIDNTTTTDILNGLITATYCLHCVIGGNAILAISFHPTLGGPRVLNRLLTVNLPGNVDDLLTKFTSSFDGQLLIARNATTITTVTTTNGAAVIVDVVTVTVYVNYRPLLTCDCNTNSSGHLGRLLGSLVLLAIIFNILTKTTDFTKHGTLVKVFVGRRNTFHLKARLIICLILNDPIVNLACLTAGLLRSINGTDNTIILSLLQRKLLLVPLLCLVGTLYNIRNVTTTRLVTSINTTTVSTNVLLR